MKYTIFAAVFAIIFAVAAAYPYETENHLDEDQLLNFDSSLEHNLRQKRATCDLLANEQLCAAHCLAQGFKGGWCDSRKVCNCRR
ncbi:U-Asilidin(12)-Dg3b-like [Condylostylus longicornis]|uniref:U-Asilidin(12)-Dg3b-like n=1 Tax=Condylostylus longicornis TaxID=2530218 RepID=UPI00244E03BC|nr:U-Asilidin(12)-Dg3b-like [Condylostylus longicornis]